MPTYDYKLTTPPEEPRSRELWLQHAAGFILFEDIRQSAMDEIDPHISEEAKQAAQKAIDDAECFTDRFATSTASLHHHHFPFD
ncbi:MAG: hypothetical protein KDA65_08775 [Planctomycetaceae bacterium]|nr:hypothetical protein [Planctomycetaceae bacterium]